MTIKEIVNELDEAIMDCEDSGEAIDFLRYQTLEKMILLMEYDRVLCDVLSDEEYEAVSKKIAQNTFCELVHIAPESNFKDYVLQNMEEFFRYE